MKRPEPWLEILPNWWVTPWRWITQMLVDSQRDYLHGLIKERAEYLYAEAVNHQYAKQLTPEIRDAERRLKYLEEKLGPTEASRQHGTN